ncbi:MAG TPA: site-specific integrase [Dehalococcoidia bacterium]|jgi:integrase|nr:site-specific integrase [Dehalococcoidia bacterium]|tara:strand:- start:107 stop:739 length:633 start_codon:yes stop_codon:yes gene_type:complete
MTLANRATPLPPALVGAEVAQDTLTQDEYEAFKAALPSWRDRLICMMLRNTGLRINELLSLPGAHCALGGPSYVIHVVRSKKRKGIETTTVYEPIYINPGLGVQLRDYIKGNNYTMTEPIFGGGDNQRDARKITQRGLRFIFEKTGRESIGRPISPKAFRSFFVQTMVDGNVPMAMASKMVGHEDIRTTQAHYYVLSADRRRAIGEGIPV